MQIFLWRILSSASGNRAMVGVAQKGGPYKGFEGARRPLEMSGVQGSVQRKYGFNRPRDWPVALYKN